MKYKLRHFRELNGYDSERHLDKAFDDQFELYANESTQGRITNNRWCKFFVYKKRLHHRFYLYEYDVNAALDDAIANRATQIYFYAPDYPKEKLVWITSGYEYEYDIYSIHNIHTYISPYGYVNPVTGESGDSFWVDVTIKYK